MSIQRPIFQQGLLGAANREVCNLWTDGAEIARDGADAIEWARGQMVGFRTADAWLAKITSATLLSTNRWSYAGVAFDLDGSNAPIARTESFGVFTGALNIREIRNGAGVVDGSPLPAGASIGPVGSVWNAGTSTWTTTALEGYVWMRRAYRTNGAELVFFDTMNPGKC